MTMFSMNLVYFSQTNSITYDLYCRVSCSCVIAISFYTKNTEHFVSFFLLRNFIYISPNILE